MKLITPAGEKIVMSGLDKFNTSPFMNTEFEVEMSNVLFRTNKYNDRRKVIVRKTMTVD